VGIIFIAYALQVKYKPFLDPNVDLASDQLATSNGAKLVYVRAGNRASMPESRWDY
jgi:hypothetical protein